MVTYSSLTRSGVEGGTYVQIFEPQLHRLLRSLLPDVNVDEDWYRNRYGDVSEAINDGKLSSAREHYVSVGYFEGRLPREILVDENWYLSVYQDVANAVNKGRFESGQEHFDLEGYKEGRIPYESWAL